MNALEIPAFVPALLKQGSDPRDVPAIAGADITGWSTSLATAVLGELGLGNAGGSFLSDGHMYLLVPHPTVCDRTAYVRLPLVSESSPWRAPHAAVVLTLAGALGLEMTAPQRPELGPQYVRRFEPESALAVHPGALCCLQSDTSAVQLVVTDGLPAPIGRALTSEGYQFAVAAVRTRLSRFTAVNRSSRPASAGWLDRWPSMDTPRLSGMFQRGTALLEHLADDKNLLTRLVTDIEHHSARLSGSRVTLLLDRLCLYRAPDGGFEIRLNMNPRRVNQEVPHDHGYNFATRILTGGYLHVVRRRTDSGTGPFTGDDLLPAIVAIERPGSAYALEHTAVHQALMLPGTTTLFVRGPRLKERSYAAEELTPTPSTWPAAATPGAPPQHSRPASLDEYRAMRDQLACLGLIERSPSTRLVPTGGHGTAS
ncbi:hypothetical protein ACWD01_32805 [Streptomyces sp. NPDC002835]